MAASRLVGPGGSKQRNRQPSLLVLVDLVDGLGNVELATPIGIPSETVVSDVHFLLRIFFQLSGLLEELLVPPVVGEESVGYGEKLVVFAGEGVLVLDGAFVCADAVVPDNFGVGYKLVHFIGQKFQPFLEVGYCSHISLNVDEVPVELALSGNGYKEKGELAGGEHLLAEFEVFGDEGAQAESVVAFAEGAPVPGRN